MDTNLMVATLAAQAMEIHSLRASLHEASILIGRLQNSNGPAAPKTELAENGDRAVSERMNGK